MQMASIASDRLSVCFGSQREREPVPGYGQHLKSDHLTHRLSNPAILSTSWHVESFNLSREFTQQNRLIYLICHLPLWCFRDVLFNIGI